MTRSEHLAWCKKRAHEYADTGEYANAITSMMSDMEKHEETAFNGSPTGTALMMAAMMGSQTKHDVKRWIDGFN